MTKLVHLHKSSQYHHLNVLLLLIPVIIFGLVLASYIFSKSVLNIQSFVATENQPFISDELDSESRVLGNTDNLDKLEDNYIK